MSIWNLKPEPVIGIDISSTAVKLLELSYSGKKFKVETYAVEALSEKTVEDKKIIEIEKVGSIISRLVKRAKPKALHVAIAVAGPDVITKTITMEEGMLDVEMIELIREEPAQFLGEDIDEIHVDIQILGANEKEISRVDVLLAACRSETLEARITALELAGLKTRIVDVEKYALENAFLAVTKNDPEIDENEIIALVEVGATTTTMNVLGEQQIIYNHEEIFGGRQLTERIQERYELDYEQAEYSQRTGGEGLPDDYETEILNPFKDEIAQQISRMVQYYYSSSSYGKLSHILIAGGCASISNILEPISNKVGGHVTIVNPFVGMSIASRVNKTHLMNDAPALMIACGLALRNFDENKN
ncbi:MAG: type IV pilus assembly protein PilM [Thiomargarita sp.]|nr:type IV pilus assembly protein PilM [Thiomargarita sp.]